jgi:TP901 family phage tail tape measure protein
MDGDLAQAAEISAKILGGWTSAAATAQERTDFLTHSTDLMTKAANASAVDVKGLSQGIFNAQGIAKTAGVSFDDLTTTLATLAPRFASSSEAGNSLKNMIARLQPTTDPAADAMRGLVCTPKRPVQRSTTRRVTSSASRRPRNCCKIA